METYVVWTLTALFTLIGLAGVVIPLLPGTTLILLAMLVHKLLLPGDISWVVLGWIGGFWLLSVIVDFVGVILGARAFGGGKWGMLGAVVAEKLIAQKTNRASLLAGVGAAVGFLLSTIGRLVCALAMIVLFVMAVANAG